MSMNKTLGYEFSIKLPAIVNLTLKAQSVVTLSPRIIRYQCNKSIRAGYCFLS